MSKVVILGNSFAGISAAEKIKQKDSSIEVDIFLLEKNLPYNRDTFADIVSGKISVKEASCHTKEFYAERGIGLIENEVITRVNFKHKKIYTESKNQYNFDKLILTGFYDNKYPDIKGTNKNGIYGFTKLKDVKALVEQLALIDTVVIQSSTVDGFKLAAALLKSKKEVYLISPKEGVFSQAFSKEALDIIREPLEKQGLTVIERNPIVEILGDSDLKAVRLQSQKVIGTNAVIFTDTTDNFKMFMDYDLNMLDHRIVVNSNYQTNYPDVYALDIGITNPSSEVEFVRYGKDSCWLDIEANIAASSITKSEKPYQAYQQAQDVSLMGLDFSFIGDFQNKPETESKYVSSLESKTYEKYVICDQQLKGAVLLNCSGKRTEISRIIEQKEPFEVQVVADTVDQSDESMSVNTSEQITSEVHDTSIE